MGIGGHPSASASSNASSHMGSAVRLSTTERHRFDVRASCSNASGSHWPSAAVTSSVGSTESASACAMPQAPRQTGSRGPDSRNPARPPRLEATGDSKRESGAWTAFRAAKPAAGASDAGRRGDRSEDRRIDFGGAVRRPRAGALCSSCVDEEKGYTRRMTAQRRRNEWQRPIATSTSACPAVRS